MRSCSLIIMELMSDEEWASIQHDRNLSRKENADRYAARWASTVDWKNLPPEAGKDVRKTIRDTAHDIIVKKNRMPDPGGYFMDRPADIVFP